MLKYCYEQWNKNKDILEANLRKDHTLCDRDYEYLVGLVVKHILNENNTGISWDPDKITTIDNGDYQGTLLFLIPEDTYQPSEYEYLMTYVGYGSCSGCDTLLAIQPWESRALTDEEIKRYMSLCKDILTNMIKPYNCGWREDKRFETVSIDD